MENYFPINDQSGSLRYGKFTELSQALNASLGDKSGRTVSRRTTHGFKKTFELDMPDEDAENIVHSAMVASAFLLFSKNDASKLFGGIIALGLTACYHNG